MMLIVRLLSSIAYQEGAFKEFVVSFEEALRMEKRNARFHFLIRPQLVRLEQKEEAKSTSCGSSYWVALTICGSNTSAANNPVI